LDKKASVALGVEADIKNDNDSTVLGGAYESSNTLLELDDGTGNLIVVEGVFPLFGQVIHAGGNERVIRDLEGKLIDEEAT
jgi:hypothetical protein